MACWLGFKITQISSRNTWNYFVSMLCGRYGHTYYCFHKRLLLTSVTIFHCNFLLTWINNSLSGILSALETTAYLHILLIAEFLANIDWIVLNLIRGVSESYIWLALSILFIINFQQYILGVPEQLSCHYICFFLLKIDYMQRVWSLNKFTRATWGIHVKVGVSINLYRKLRMWKLSRWLSSYKIYLLNLWFKQTFIKNHRRRTESFN